VARLRDAKVTVRAPTFDSAGWRVVMSCLMALTIFVSAFICATDACGAFDGDQAVASQTIAGKTPSTMTDAAVEKATHGKIAGGFASCSGHCAAHSLSLPAPVAELAVFIPTAAAWRLLPAVEVSLGGPARLDRPPRL